MPAAPEAPRPKPDGRLVWLRHGCGSTAGVLVSQSTSNNAVPFPSNCPGKHECKADTTWKVVGEFHGE